ncbi:hypothetical protein FisN_4Lh065 [Fistulifera solaris]|uniref:Uncharacterized protein n=1 Tax=Fistulifera solaris TaxID=1519565 RepID=A0A1Z5JZT5_FISSO|nr:hypothetical protein FisN_4Lh065 [Fistulifera solaris]|eukprot:GAX19356.1 hypothetical protein FisN_4Lh065 [Fistulifera solaris]
MMTDIGEAYATAQTPQNVRLSKSPGRSYSDVRERFARRQQRKLEEERLRHARETLHVPTELTRSSAFMSPIIQATLKRGRETSHPASKLISPTSVTHSIPRESHGLAVEEKSIDDNQDADTDDQNVISRYPLLCAASLRHMESVTPRLRHLQGRGSLLDSAIFFSSCNKKKIEEDRRSAQANQLKDKNAEQLVHQKPALLACRADANTKKFAYQTIVNAGLILGRTVTDCSVLSKDVYRLNSTVAHRQRDDDMDFFLHESGCFEEEALDVTLRPDEQVVQSRSFAGPIWDESSIPSQDSPSRANRNIHFTADASDFAQLHIRSTSDIPFLPDESTIKPDFNDFDTPLKETPSWHNDDERETFSRPLATRHHLDAETTRGFGIKLNPRTTIAGLRLPSKPKLQDNIDLPFGVRQHEMDDPRGYTDLIPETIFYESPHRDSQRLTTFNALELPDDESRFAGRGDILEANKRGEELGKDSNAATAPLEIASLRGEIVRLRTRIAEARTARFVSETDKVQAMLDRDCYQSEISELKTRALTVKREEEEPREQMEGVVHARDVEAKKLRPEFDEARSSLNQKKLF